MPLTKTFRETVSARAASDPAFSAALYQEAIQSILDGDTATGRSLLRDTVNATIGFPGLAARLGIPAKSLMRMLGAAGNPQLSSLVAVLQALKQEFSVGLTVQARPIQRARKATTESARPAPQARTRRRAAA